MKTKRLIKIAILFIPILITACHKEEEFDQEISQEDAMHYAAMQESFKQAEAYQDSLKLCVDSILSSCNTIILDSMFHHYTDLWQYHHDLYSHENPIDDHHHMQTKEHHEHCEHCTTEGHSLEDHENIENLLNEHKPYHP